MYFWRHQGETYDYEGEMGKKKDVESLFSAFTFIVETENKKRSYCIRPSAFKWESMISTIFSTQITF